MEWIEVTGRTVEEAVDAALDELGVDEADIEYEVLEEPKRGLFGRLGGGASARIRARVKPISREKPDRRRRSGRREGGRGGERGERPDRGDRSNRAAAPGRDRAPASERPAAEARSSGGESSGSAARSRGRSRTRPPRPAGATPTDSAGRGVRGVPHETEENAVSGSDVSLDEQVELAESFTRGLVERFQVRADVAARADGDDDVLVDITGEELGLLIGPRAATLDAMQELVRTAVQRRIGGHGARIHVDVAGYRAKRQAALAEFTRRAAQRAIESGRDQVFEPMSPIDRKVVHDTANEIEGVATVSEGEEPRRRVVIKAT